MLLSRIKKIHLLFYASINNKIYKLISFKINLVLTINIIFIWERGSVFGPSVLLDFLKLMLCYVRLLGYMH